MNGCAALWILALGIVLAEAQRASGPRSVDDWKHRPMSEVGPRGYRTSRRSTRRPPARRHMDDFIYAPSKFSRLVPSAGPSIPDVATAAAEAAMVITRNLARDLSETAAVTVAQAVAHILSQSYQRRGIGRRAINTNSNYNLNFNGQSQTGSDNGNDNLPTELGRDSSRNSPNYAIVMGREPPTPAQDPRWQVEEMALPDWNERYIVTNDDPKKPCGYRSIPCFLRRARPTSAVQLKDEAANGQKEEATTPRIYFPEEGTIVEAGDVLLDDKDLIVEAKDLPSDPSRKYATDRTPPRRRSKNDNLNENYRRHKHPDVHNRRSLGKDRRSLDKDRRSAIIELDPNEYLMR